MRLLVLRVCFYVKLCGPSKKMLRYSKLSKRLLGARIEQSVDQAIESGNLFPLLADRRAELKKAWHAEYANSIGEGVMAHAQVNQPDWSTFWSAENHKTFGKTLKIYTVQDTYEIFDRVISEKREVIRDKFTNEPLEFLQRLRSRAHSLTRLFTQINDAVYVSVYNEFHQKQTFNKEFSPADWRMHMGAGDDANSSEF